MNGLIKWFTLGEYSYYIWPAYGLVWLVLLINLMGLKWQKYTTYKELQQWLKRVD